MTAPQQKKLKINGPVVVTANRLSDGVVVYRDGSGGWSEIIERAKIVDQVEEAKELLSLALSDENRAVGAYIAPLIAHNDGQFAPGNIRERIRSRGPTVPLPTGYVFGL
jgi:hypothetical protein